MFYGSGDDFAQPCVPDELRWSLSTLDADVAAGRVLLLDVVVAIKSAMPKAWLADHGMAADFLSIVFSMSRPEILGVYAAALRAWGAADVLSDTAVPPPAGGATRLGEGGAEAPKAGGGAKAQQGGEAQAQPGGGAAAVQSSDPFVPNHRAPMVLQLMRIFAQELQLCISSHPAPPEPPAELTVDGIDALQSMFLSARLAESAGRGSAAGWVQLSSHLPQVLSLSCREYLFRRVSGTSEDDLQRMKKNRVNNVERSCILEWAASIAAAMRGRRNPLAIQVQPASHTSAPPSPVVAGWGVLHVQAHHALPQFSKDGVEELGFGEAITRSFFCDVAEAFSKGGCCPCRMLWKCIPCLFDQLSTVQSCPPPSPPALHNGFTQRTLACG